MKVTNQLIKDLDPCSSRFNNYLSYYKNMSHSKAQFLGLKNITHSDKLWVVTKLIPKHNLHLAAADIAQLVLHIYEEKYPNDFRPRNAIAAARSGNKDRANAAYDALYAANAANAAYYTSDAAYYAAYAASDSAYAADAANAAYWAAVAAARATKQDPKILKQIRTILLKHWK